MPQEEMIKCLEKEVIETCNDKCRRLSGRRKVQALRDLCLPLLNMVGEITIAKGRILTPSFLMPEGYVSFLEKDAPFNWQLKKEDFQLIEE